MDVRDKHTTPELTTVTQPKESGISAFFNKIGKAFGRKVTPKSPDGDKTPKPSMEKSITTSKISGTKIEPQEKAKKSIFSKVAGVFKNIFSSKTTLETKPSEQSKINRQEYIDRTMLNLAPFTSGSNTMTPKDFVQNELRGLEEFFPPEKAIKIVEHAIDNLVDDVIKTMHDEHRIQDKDIAPREWALEMKAELKAELDKIRPPPPPNPTEGQFLAMIVKYGVANKFSPDDQNILNEYFKNGNVDNGAKALAGLYKQNPVGTVDILKNIPTAPEFKGVDSFAPKMIVHLGQQKSGELVAQLLKDEITAMPRAKEDGSDLKAVTGTFLRGNSLTTKFVSFFQKAAFNNISNNKLLPFTEQVSNKKIKEPTKDPLSLVPFTIDKAGQKRLTEMTQNTFDQLMDISKNIPSELKTIFRSVYEGTKEKVWG